MAQLFNITPVKTYATKANAEKAVEKLNIPDELNGKLIRYFIATSGETGRFFPVFVGEAAVQAGVHFHFNVIG